MSRAYQPSSRTRGATPGARSPSGRVHETLCRVRRSWIALVIACLPLGDGRAQSRCDPSYPDVCLPPPPPDLDCSDLDEHDFEVRPPDPHGLDRDHDGIGCETRR